MSRRLYLSDGSNRGRKGMFPLLELPHQKIYYILSFSSVADMAAAYITEVKNSIPSDHLSMPWQDRVKQLHQYFDHLDAMKNFLAKHHHAEFYAE